MLICSLDKIKDMLMKNDIGTQVYFSDDELAMIKQCEAENKPFPYEVFTDAATGAQRKIFPVEVTALTLDQVIQIIKADHLRQIKNIAACFLFLTILSLVISVIIVSNI